MRPKALTIKGKPSTRVLFADNVLADVAGDHKKLDASLVEDNLEAAR